LGLLLERAGRALQVRYGAVRAARTAGDVVSPANLPDGIVFALGITVGVLVTLLAAWIDNGRNDDDGYGY